MNLVKRIIGKPTRIGTPEYIGQLVHYISQLLGVVEDVLKHLRI